MLVSHRWLGRHLDTIPDSDTVRRGLEQLGLEVVSVRPFGEDFQSIELVEIERRAPHPASDHLAVVTIRRARGATVDVVTGAQNGQPGDRVWYAPPGARLPDGRVLETRAVRGIASPGMLLSGEELGYQAPPGDLWIWPQSDPVGTTFLDAVGGADVIYEVELTPNLAQYLQSMRHLAAELGALWNIPLVPLTTPFAWNNAAVAEVKAPDRCPLYALVELTLKPGAVSPLWLQTLLLAVGQRIIHPAVDVTNFVLWDLGQPLHAFDAERVKGPLVVRLAEPRETLELLDGTAVELTPHDLVIADQEGPVALAGIMGGTRAQVDARSTRIWLECAHFVADPIFQSYKAHRLPTDAALHFGKGTDPAMVFLAPQLVVEILRDADILEAIGPSVLRGQLPPQDTISWDARRISQLLGVAWEEEKVRTALVRLGYHIEGGTVVVPRYRHDVSSLYDLAEDVARFYGLEAIQPRLPVQRTELARRDARHLWEETVRDLMTSAGYTEVMTRTLVNPKAEAPYVAGDRGELVRVTNPLREEESVLRRVLLPSLLEVVRFNRARHNLPIRIFEVGSVFSRRGDAVEETQELAAVLGLEPVPAFPLHLEPSVYDLTGLADFLLQRLGWAGERRPWSLVPSFLHPGRSQEIWVNGHPVGYVGELRPRLAESYRLKRLGVLVIRWPEEIRVSPFRPVRPSRFPEVERDLSLVIGDQTSYEAVHRVIWDEAGDLMKSLDVIDRYEGAFGVSLTVRMTFQSEVTTLTDEAVDALVAKVVNRLSNIGVSLRQ
ncbi:MAG: phenylalanine--tRNA ligase subunit beta [Firmicutes bacterium]|nr:phenylalanine--tRNA ligase subunit beta [Bacillota bacterium]